jgi:hypothetical protein
MRKVKFVSVFMLLALLVGAAFGVGVVQGSPPGAGEALDSQTQEYVLSLVIRALYEEGAPYVELEETLSALSLEEARLFMLLSATIQRLGFPEDAPNLFVVPPDRQQDLLRLTRRALYSDEPVKDEVDALSDDERKLYTDFAAAIEGITSGQAAAYVSELDQLTIEAMLTLMEEHDVGMLEVPESELMEALKEASLERDAPASDKGD